MRSRIAVVLAILFVSFVSFAASGALAQTMYKSTMPDGRVIYGEKPVPDAKRVDTVTPPPAKSGITTVTPQEKSRVEQQEKQRANVERTQSARDDARQRLQQAEAARDAGKEPQPGERIGTAGGASRLTDAYHARQAGLEKAVQDARKQADPAQGR